MAPTRGGFRGRRNRGGSRSSTGAPSARRGVRLKPSKGNGISGFQKAVMDVDSFNMDTCDLRDLWLKPELFGIHLKAQEQNKFRYCAAMKTLQSNGVEILQAAKVRALAAAWARHDQEFSDTLLSDSDHYGVVEVLKALSILDAGRKVRVEEKRAAQLKQTSKTSGKKGKSRIGRRLVEIKKNIQNLNSMKAGITGTVSGALTRKVKRWTRCLQKEKLEFYALHLPTETWRHLADICHLHPDRDFPALPWFLRYCFDEDKAPEGSLVSRCKGINAENVSERLMEVDIPYAHVKQYSARLNEEAKQRIARYTSDIDTLLWEYEDIVCAGVDEVINERLGNGESVNLPFGKLMERLLLIRKMQKPAPFYRKLLPFAEARLNSTKIPLESPVVVIGDASGSMTVAIETSTIIASFLRALTNAKLVFFDNNVIQPPFIPETIEEVLELAMVVKTGGLTCPAAALWPFYKNKETVKTFILATDEEENTNLSKSSENYRFQDLFGKYCKEIYPAKLVFVSFLSHQHAKGQMTEPLQSAGYDVMQFRLDRNRPDLTKLNNLVGQLSLEALDFDKQILAMEKQLKQEGLRSALEKLMYGRKN